jgi:hypothetical protein
MSEVLMLLRGGAGGIIIEAGGARDVSNVLWFDDSQRHSSGVGTKCREVERRRGRGTLV